jgi:hypothetical protein
MGENKSRRGTDETKKQEEIDKQQKEIDEEIAEQRKSRTHQYRQFIFLHRKILLILLWGVTGIGTAAVVPSISQWLTDVGITLEPKTVQFVLNNTNKWTDSKMVSINNPNNISLLAKLHNFDPRMFSIPNAIHTSFLPTKDTPYRMKIDINGTGLPKQRDWTYNGQVELYRNNNTFVDKVDVDIKILTNR